MRNAMDVQEIAIGWWPGDRATRAPPSTRTPTRAVPGFDTARLEPDAARWDAELGEYVLDHGDVRSAADPHGAALAFGRSAVGHACTVCDWDPALAASVQGTPPPVR